MRIGLVTTWFERGAAYVSRQYQQALSSRHEVFIYARGGESKAVGDPAWDSDRITWAHTSRLKEIPTAIVQDHFAAWLRDCKIDLVFFNEQFCWDPVIYCAEQGILTGAYIDYYTEQTIPYFALHDFLVCNTRRHCQAFDWHPNTHFIKWGTDVNLFSPRPDIEARHAPMTFFHSAGMNPHRKGTDIFINALDLLHDQPMHGLVHTQVPLKGAFPALAGKICRLEETGRLTVVERTVPAPGLYHKGDVYVYPTRLDGLGLTVVEALSCGLPTIAPDQAPMNEFVKPLVNGRLTPVDRVFSRWDGYYWPQCVVRPESLAIDMKWYVDNTAELPCLAREAREYASREFRWTDRYDSLCQLFENAVHMSPDWRDDALANAKAFELGRSARAKPKGLAYLTARLHDQHPAVFDAIKALTTSFRA